MIITLLSFKGGTGKTTTAIHLAGWLNETAPTALADGDLNRSAVEWSKRGKLPFRVADEEEGVRIARDHEHIVIDTPARPAPVKFKGLVQNADLIVLVCEPEILSMATLMPAISDLRSLDAKFKVLLTKVRPNTTEADSATSVLADLNVSHFAHHIRNYIAARKAALAGVLVKEVDDPHALDLWDDFGDVAREVLNG
jgi:chromosome partitioning protein